MTELLNTLYVTTVGASLHLDADAVRIVRPEIIDVRRLPLQRIDHIVVFRGAAVSQDLLIRCAADGRSVTWLSGSGRYLARVEGPTTGNGLLRRAQMHAHCDDSHRLELGRRFVAGKVQNARQVLLRAARDQTGSAQSRLRAAAGAHASCLAMLPAAGTLDEVRGLEGQVARVYFTALAPVCRRGGLQMISARIRRPATDPVNALMSFFYGMLRVRVHGALETVGLDPYIGFLHGIRPGKPALALDLMEEFRPILADRLVLTLVNRGQVRPQHFTTYPSGAVELTDEGRREVLAAWQAAGTREVEHAALRGAVPTALLPHMQARLLARTLRGDIPAYEPWVMR